jgi:hypothetical protein
MHELLTVALGLFVAVALLLGGIQIAIAVGVAASGRSTPSVSSSGAA